MSPVAQDAVFRLCFSTYLKLFEHGLRKSSHRPEKSTQAQNLNLIAYPADA